MPRRKYSPGSIDLLKNNLDYLTLLGKTKRAREWRKLIEIASVEQLEAVWACIHNILYNHGIPLSDGDKRKLKRHKDTLLALDSKRLTKEQKKRALNQYGGFLPAILAPIIGIAGGLLADLITK